jgi:putative cell wall-binding protein
VSGSAAVGGTLSATTSGWPSGTSIGWSWQADGQAIPGATGPNYVPSISDQGRRITATASGWKPGLYTSYTISAPTATVTGGTTSERLSGPSRYETAVAISRAGFAPGVPVAYVAAGTNFPDALGAAPAAALQGGPLLLTAGDALPAAVRAELVRLAPARIVVVGGANVVSPAVLSALEAIAPTTRVAGADRFETSRLVVADAYDSASIAYVATGLNFPDALTAAAAAAHLDGPVVLVNGAQGTIDAASVDLLRSLGVTTVRIAGSSVVVSNGIQADLARAGFAVERVAGADRYATATAISVQAFASAPTVYLATGLTFPDALAGAALAGSQDAPLFIAAGTCIPDAVSRAMTALGASRVVLLGGTPALSSAVGSFQRC